MDKFNFWSSFFEASQRVTNVTLVTREGGHKATHALLLAAGSDLLRSLLQELPDTEEHAVIILPDFSASDLQLCLDAVIGGSTQGLDNSVLFGTLGISVNWYGQFQTKIKAELLDSQHEWKSKTLTVKEERIFYDSDACNNSDPKEADLARTRPYSCEKCKKTLTSSGHLKVHGLVHSGEKHHLKI